MTFDEVQPREALRHWERVLLASDTVFAEADSVPVSMRWEYVAKWLEPARRQRLYEAPDPVMRYAMASEDTQVHIAAMEWILLRQRFFFMLMHNNLGRRVHNEAELLNGTYWQHRIVDKMDGVKFAAWLN